MLSYDGPAFNKNKDEKKQKRFEQPRQSEAEKNSYQPAYKVEDKQTIVNESDQKELDLDVDSSQFDFKPHKPTNKDDYRVPFLDQRQPKKLTESFQGTLADENDDVEANQTLEQARLEKVKGEAEDAQASTHEAPPLEPSFQATQLPKPYKADPVNKVDQNIRILSKRLAKSKESYLLFE